MAESGPGLIRIFDDFTGPQARIALTIDNDNLGLYWERGGEGIEETDAGVVRLDSDGLSGVIRLTASTTDLDTTFIATGRLFDLALMGTVVVEQRVRLGNLNNKQCFIGLCDENTFDLDATGDILDGPAGTTWVLNGSDLAGFAFSDEITTQNTNGWYGVFNGGTATGDTTAAGTSLSFESVAGEWAVFRMEATANGTVRWYVNGILQKTVTGALSTTTDLNYIAAVYANSANVAEMDVDYVLIECNRDWTI